ncbi:MAG TPA: hypothetical protein VGP46_02070, partial [Acidimicrobiales bacterium]|nr:hypothetical protein [Acidimicrobiales bacterium]
GQLIDKPSNAQSAQFNAVFCASVSSCFAVGFAATDPSTALDLPLASSLTGTVWTRPATFGTTDRAPEAVSCPTASLCFAVGEASPQLDNDEAIGMQDSKGTWTTVFAN